jgi:DNA-binding XRE family transcriptional regulator
MVRRIPISKKVRWAIFQAHKGVCYYCGSEDATHVDHIVPRIHGGTDRVSNLVAACLPCNLKKSRHRLPPKAEEEALRVAEDLQEKIVELLDRHIPNAGLLPIHCRVLRAGLDWTVRDLAARAGVNFNTVVRLEKGRPVRYSVVLAIRKALIDAGCVIYPDGWIKVPEPAKEPAA